MRIPFFLLLVFPFTALAASPVVVRNAWAPPSLSQPNGIAFLTLESAQDDTLIGATSDCCAAVELHTHVMQGDVMRMRRVKKGIPLSAHTPVTLRPGSYHIMLIGLKTPMENGATIPLVLHFTHAPDQKVEVTVSLDKMRAQLTHARHPDA